MIIARNENLQNYLNDFVAKKRLRYTYIRNQCRNKVGLVASFVDYDSNDKKELYVGVSKVSKGDIFQLDMGLVKAINNSVPFGDFVYDYENGKLPRIANGWRVARDEFGYVVENEYEVFDQYEEFIEKLKNVYARLVDPAIALV